MPPRPLLVVLLAAALGACAADPPSPPSPGTEARPRADPSTWERAPTSGVRRNPDAGFSPNAGRPGRASGRLN